MTRKQEETLKIKEALKCLAYRVKVRHGTGTASGWIKVYIPKAIWAMECQKVEMLIAEVTQRPMTEYNHILVYWYE